MPTPRNLLRRTPRSTITEAEIEESQAAFAKRIEQIVSGIAIATDEVDPADDVVATDEAVATDDVLPALEAEAEDAPELAPAPELVPAPELAPAPQAASSNGHAPVVVAETVSVAEDDERPWVGVGPGVADPPATLVATDAPAPAPRRPTTARKVRIAKSAPARGAATGRAATPVVVPPTPTQAPSTAVCPYCALVLDPAPTASRRCPRCRERIVVRRVPGRTVYITEAAVPVFEAQWKQTGAKDRNERARARWLELATVAGASSEKLKRAAGAPPTEASVDAAKALYFATVDRAFRAAKHDRDWDAASRIRRDEALALHRVARRPVPPTDDVLALHREGVAAELKGIGEVVREAQLAARSCCDVCVADEGRIVRISTETRVRSLPHEDCPRGLCRCHWVIPAKHIETMRRYARRSRTGT